MNKGYHLTRAGIAELETELTELKERRKEIAVRLKAAKAEGDLSENADYTVALKDQEYTEGRIAEIEKIIKNAVIIDAPKSNGKVGLGSSVEVKCDGKVYSYTVVGSLESNPEVGKISEESPIGKALLGVKVGDTVEIKIPSGSRSCKVTKII